MVWVDYAQLEGYWDQAGGDPKLAPLMAAIALAESGHLHDGKVESNSDALNPTDNHGTQSSFGSWQVSNGTHMPPIGNWNDPAANAREAVKIYQEQGLKAWGTYTSGAYKPYLKGGVPPQEGGGTQATDTSFWTWILGQLGSGPLSGLAGGAGELEAPFKLFFDLSNPAFWMRLAKGGIGAGLILVGLYLMVHDSSYARGVRERAGEAGKESLRKKAGEGAAAAILIPK